MNATPAKMRGITLIELIVVIVLIAAVTVSVVQRSDGGAQALRSQADQLANDIRYTQALAMTEGARRRINFTVASNSYQIAMQDNTPLPHPATGSTAPVTLTGNVAMASTTNAFIVFNGEGRPYSDAATPGTPLAAVAVVTLNVGGQNRQVQITPVTGRVSQQ